MVYVLYSVLCSVTVSILLKLARRYHLDARQIVVWNYPAAVALTYVFFKPDLIQIAQVTHPWSLYVPLALLLPFVFIALNASIRHVGIVRTEVAQRLSLCIPLIAAFWLFNEQLRVETLAALGLGLLAILCIIGWHKSGGKGNSMRASSGAWLFPALVFFGYGICDILFKALAQSSSIAYTSSMFAVFVLAMFVAFLYLIYLLRSRSGKFSPAALAWGVVLGAFNFANILFYMKAHRALPENPSIVFTGMNIGVISIGALVGLLLFKEKLSRLNVIGLVLAILSVLLIANFR